MIVTLLLIFLTISTFIFITIGTPTKCWVDRMSPLNLIMYQEPRVAYSGQHVNVWVDKNWKVDGDRIPCRLERTSLHNSLDNANKARSLIIYSHGNAENLLYCTEFIRLLSKSLNVDVITYDYSGYGLNKIDSFERTEEGVNLTLKAVYESMIRDHKYASENIILWGYSLGSGPSTYVASQLNKLGTSLKGLVLFGAYSSILNVVRDVVQYEEVVNIFHNRWNTIKIIHQVKCPILLLHGQNDGLISVKHAQSLKSANPNAKLVIMPNTGHTNFSWKDSVKEVKDWMRFVDFTNQM